ncbi:glycosyl transferase family 2 [Jiella pacifica]|uniref:Glycosyl transferase family 2 n=1 Tax=Jiella pacifica TaxID=2696469 RepID=A0A6N9SUW7_9HYPH|nr:glycosyl transferase family 2 [Jiella pacifica]NDW02840.1 glycosyl transferase family 2 [Jiella pacifica]
MLSVFIDCGPDDHKLASTLGSLVPGAVEGIVREVVLVDRGMGADARKVADHTGCRVIARAALRDAIRAAKGDWLLFVEPGARLVPGWIAAVVEHVERVQEGRAKMPSARFRRAAIDRPRFLQRIREIRTAIAEGFVVRKEQAIGLAGQGVSVPTLEGMAKGVAVTRLDAEIRPAHRG